MPEPAKPNVLILSCHDIGTHIGCYGIETVHTPNLDRLAAEGRRFDRAFCTAPTCSPSRASIFTGRWPQQTGVLGLTHGRFAWDLHDDEVHMAQVYRDVGYHTELLGVMHETHRPDRWGYERVWDFEEQRPSCDELAEEGCKRITEFAGGGRPWFMHIGFFEPHKPWSHGGAEPDDSRGVTVPPYLEDDPAAREQLAAYQGAIRKADAAVGRVLERLAETDQDRDTIVLFLSDHGSPLPRAKASLYDPGLRVALLMRWPGGGWTGGAVHDEMISNIDLLPTLCEACGLEAPDRVAGRSFRLLLDGGPYTPNEAVYAQQNYHGGPMFFDPRRAVRTERYKLIANFTTAQPWPPQEGLRPVDEVAEVVARANQTGSNPFIELYDLQEDPNEFHDLSGDAGRVEVNREMRALLMDWMERVDDPLLYGYPVPPIYERTLELLREAQL